MFIAITTTSILAITGFVWLLNRILPLRLRSGQALRLRSGQAFKICPICAGVSGTWLWMLAAMFFGLLPTSNFQLPTAILMGGSVVGIAYQIEKRLPPHRSSLLWKTLFIPAGFIAVYSVILSWWIVFIATTILLVIMALRFTEESRSHASKSDKAVKELEKKMKKCC